MLEDSHDVFLAHDEQLVAVDLDGLARVFAKSTWSPTFNWSGRCVPSCSSLPLPTAMTSPCSGFSAVASGITMPEALVRCCPIRLTTTRSDRGRFFILHRRSAKR